jgi:hypothetical protein
MIVRAGVNHLPDSDLLELMSEHLDPDGQSDPLLTREHDFCFELLHLMDFVLQLIFEPVNGPLHQLHSSLLVLLF